jgi:hypothetical protein
MCTKRMPAVTVINCGYFKITISQNWAASPHNICMILGTEYQRLLEQSVVLHWREGGAS